MSDAPGTQDTPAGSTGAAPGGPRPEPLRFFGTSWVHRDSGYAARRAGVAVGSLGAAVAACLVLRFAYEGLRIADTGPFVAVMIVSMFAICSALAFRNTWQGFGERQDPARQASLRGLLAIGFVGSLIAYFLRSLTEAPGERLLRAEHDSAREQYARRSARRTGNPARKKSRR